MVTLLPPVLVGTNVYRVSWVSDSEDTPVTFYVYKNGVFLYSTQNTSDTFSVLPGEDLMLEVLDSPSEEIRYPFRAVLGWYRVSDAVKYIIEQYIDMVWTYKDVVYATNQGSYSWQTQQLQDGEIAQYRIRPIDAVGNIGSSLELYVMMVRNPSAPEVSFSYAGNGVLNIY